MKKAENRKRRLGINKHHSEPSFKNTPLMTIIVIEEETVITEEAIAMVEIITMGIINP